MQIYSNSDISVEMLKLGSFDNRAYIINCLKTNHSVLIDAPTNADQLLVHLGNSDLRYILMTHSHRDHIGALSTLKSQLNAQVAIHNLDADGLPFDPDILLEDGDHVTFGDSVAIEVLHTPGHTPGSLCFLLNNLLFSGDTIFPDGPGHTRTPSDLRDIVESITSKIFVLQNDTFVYPGHGESAILKEEKEKYAVFSNKYHSPDLCGDIIWLLS